jgi:hypothetical protein
MKGQLRGPFKRSSKNHRNECRGMEMRRLVVTLALASGLGLSLPRVQPVAAQAIVLPDIEERLTRARDATRKYAEKLKVELHTALKNGGPKAAIGACTSIAPDLDAVVSEEMTIEISRTALKFRNADNAPDPWEQAGLEGFVKQMAEGADPRKLEVHDVTVTTEGQKLFRYMRPIIMGENCMACHGPNLPGDIKSEIARTYPDDKAYGFNVGELRGAFTLIQQVD